ncbi:F0F1 ATP synthase subunit epsilon [Clostridium botulinum]|uniref:ATP synthase epsilon chain n=2 Tax=Clostridium TaxID=1485 RepID=A0A6B4GSW6_CLOBO|nr:MULTISPECIES: F0F1 ATP synthase subunit epsilon [Clostridium]KRU24918.1 subunit epsilon of F0F1 ATP synthase [Clostridium sporogenes]KRU31814.1 subunit epsilon of F0F1 ATP synthase [Clostridium sporogenes]KRU34079.1 subunit epsilon of F0F1 ATP synthase [Clostridium sporogenes]KRU41096.1 subunit epsilon of F0F1 ATP synthase [Clostridium sporogenes]MBZ1328311.1 F0F1 ATP synthase subunit epsilon [Clostridium botulinum]
MKDNIELTIFTPEKNIKIGEIKEVITEGLDGDLAILPNHVNMITYLKPTITKYIDLNGNKNNIFTSSGVLKVEDNKVYIICDASEKPEDIDIKRAENARKRAEERLGNKKEIDVKRAELALFRSIARIKIKEL